MILDNGLIFGPPCTQPNKSSLTCCTCLNSERFFSGKCSSRGTFLRVPLNSGIRVSGVGWRGLSREEDVGEPNYDWLVEYETFFVVLYCFWVETYISWGRIIIIIIIIVHRTIVILLWATARSHMREFTLGPLSESRSAPGGHQLVSQAANFTFGRRLKVVGKKSSNNNRLHA